MVSPGNIHTSYIIQSVQVVFKNIYAYTYISITTSNEKEVMDLKEKKEEDTEEFGKGERKGRNNMISL